MPIGFKALGATLLLSGTMLGAGMLALPLMSAGMGFEYASIALLLIWALMCYTGLMLLEICLSFPVGFGFDAIAERLFGVKGLWVFNTLGTLPRFGATSFSAISRCHGSVGMFLDQFHTLARSPQVPTLLAAFSSIALFTSYLCVSLGLFDSIAGTLRRGDHLRERIQTAFVTYLPPFAFVLLFPKGFVMALGAAAIFLTILAVLFPAGALIKLRRLDGTHRRRLGACQPAYRVIGGGLMHRLVAVAGLGIIVIQILVMRNQLPVF